MRNLCLALASVLCVVLIAPIAMAGKIYTSGELKTSVVELYTSEGCSSCPPADEFLSKLGKTRQADQIIPLAFHVDYWDYIGWKDPFSKAKYTERQHLVAKANKQSTIYTPEFFVDGVEVRGSRSITRRLKKTRKQVAEAEIILVLSEEDNSLIADISIDNITYEGDETPQIYVAVYENGLSNRVNAGENNGRTLKHDYVVRYLSKTKLTNNGEMHQFRIDLNPKWNRDALGVSVVVKLSDSGRTLQALKGVL